MPKTKKKHHESYDKNASIYLEVSKDTRKQLTALSLAVIAAIYFFINKGIANITILKLALAFYVATISCEVIASFSKSQHYADWIDKKIESTDFRSGVWGYIADIFFYIPIIMFIIATLLFFIGIFYD